MTANERKKRFAVLDFETTGLTIHPAAPVSKQPRPIEFACIVTDGEVVYDTLEFICNPGIIIEAKITEITGLTNEELAEYGFFAEYIPDIAEILVKADGVIAHNLSFDKNILKYALQREGMSLSDVNWPRIEVCSVEQTFHQYGHRVKLERLQNELIGEYEQKHRAMDDIRLLVNICKELGVFDAFR